MPALGVNSTCFKNLRLIGSGNINVFDSVQGSQGNPILFSSEGGIMQIIIIYQKKNIVDYLFHKVF